MRCRVRHLGVRVALATANGLDYALSIARYLGIATSGPWPLNIQNTKEATAVRDVEVSAAAMANI